jgi:hypothetical protein
LKDANGVSVKVRFVARDGALGIAGMDDRGGPRWERLERIQTLRRQNTTTFRFYNLFALPARFQDREIRFSLLTNDDDLARGLNRAENLQAIPFGDPDFDGLYARRADTESLNRYVEDTLYLNRAHSVGHLQQLSDLLGLALLVNACTLARAAPERQRLKAA